MTAAPLALDRHATVSLLLGVLLVLTLFRIAFVDLLNCIESMGDELGASALRALSRFRTAIGADLVTTTSAAGRDRVPDLARRLFGALLALAFFLAMNLVDWASLTLALAGMLGTGEATAIPATWVTWLDKSLALAILLPLLYSGWHLAELLGESQLLVVQQTTRTWRRIQLAGAVLALALSLVCGVTVAVYRALTMMSAADSSLITPAMLSAWVTPLTVCSMVTMVMSLMISAALACEAGVVGLLGLLPVIVLLLLHSAVRVLTTIWASLFRMVHGAYAVVVRVGTMLLRIPHSTLVLANRWALRTAGPWRWVGIPVAIVSGVVHDTDIPVDPRLSALSPASPSELARPLSAPDATSGASTTAGTVRSAA